ncbi:hypothetical protein E1A91_D02G004300v1 [Gossypium mustelinum]|uniref:Uncharacterized protein n=1 Tax=Gossypium mustelinum TaxID=34275 RepID=A0A5D2VRI0_GOSMU|nr:hypothetical protein E1A91_D02G004300v1 [Gossypium mustelinum]
MHTICLPLLLFIADFLFRRRSSSFSRFSPLFIYSSIVSEHIFNAGNSTTKRKLSMFSFCNDI